jgi:hypothetical protein
MKKALNKAKISRELQAMIAKDARKKIAKIRADYVAGKRARLQDLKIAYEQCREDRASELKEAKSRAKTIVEVAKRAAKRRCEIEAAFSVKEHDEVNAANAAMLAADREARKKLKNAARARRDLEANIKDAHPHLAKRRARSTAERRSESDDEVRSNVDPHLLPLFEEVKGKIKGSERRSRTEAFLEYAEAHPEDVLFAREREAASSLHRAIMAQQREPRHAPRTRKMLQTSASLAYGAALVSDDPRQIPLAPAKAAPKPPAAKSAKAPALTIQPAPARRASIERATPGLNAKPPPRKMVQTSAAHAYGAALVSDDPRQIPLAPAKAAPKPSAAKSAPSKVSFAQRFDAAFTKLDRAAGGHNYVTLLALREALADIPRQTFDAELNDLRRARLYALDPSEGRHRQVSEAVREAGIMESGRVLVYVARRTDEAKPKARRVTPKPSARPRRAPLQPGEVPF